MELNSSLYTFKQKSQDFIVEEELPFTLKGVGDAFFVYFEKRNLTTMEVINHLRKTLGISRKTLGVAGLKDKLAITRQWISIYKSALHKIGGKHRFLDALSQKVKILKVNRHLKPIGMSAKIANTFYIRLRAKQDISLDLKNNIKNKIENLFKKGFANNFGEQRFGINHRNIIIGKEILDNGKSDEIGNNKFENKFKVQAYVSALFNKYLGWKEKKGFELLEGDIVFYDGKYVGFDKKNKDMYEKIQKNTKKFITGPILGADCPLAKKGTDAGNFEKKFLEHCEISENAWKYFKEHKIWGLRRRLRVYPKDTKFTFQKDDILMKFTLPAGSYASILTDEIIKIVQDSEVK